MIGIERLTTESQKLKPGTFPTENFAPNRNRLERPGNFLPIIFLMQLELFFPRACRKSSTIYE